MWDFIKHKLQKLGCFAVVALMVIAVTAATKVVLGWFHYDEVSKNALSNQAGEYFGKGILVLLLFVGFVAMGRQLVGERRAKFAPPPSPSTPPPLPPPRRRDNDPKLGVENLAAYHPPRPKSMKKGCIIAAASVFALPCVALLVIYLLACEYEKQPKQPGEAELNAAEDYIRSYEGSEGSGNTPEAVAFAQDYARKLRVSRQVLFTEGKEGGMSFTHGYFLTYCFEGKDSVAVIVHVPELRHYAEDAKVTLGEYAWTLASIQARNRFPKAKRLAVGIKGALDYSTIFSGEINDQDPIKGIRERHPTLSTKPLYSFFRARTEAGGISKPEQPRPANADVSQ